MAMNPLGGGLGALLGGGAGGPGPGGPPPGHPASISLPLPQGQQNDNNDASFQAALSTLEKNAQRAIAAADDPEDKSLASKILADIHKAQLASQKEKDAAIGISPAMKFIRRQSQPSPSDAGNGGY